MPNRDFNEFALKALKRLRRQRKRTETAFRKMQEEQQGRRRRRNPDHRREEGGEHPGKHDDGVVTESTYLVIPAFDGDNGARPIPDGVPAWRSPAVNVISESLDPDTPLEVIQNKNAPTLVAGQTYLLEAWVYNLGDIAANAVNVEFFRRLPGVGATAENAELLGATVISVPRNDRARATLPFTASGEHVGHWCLHVRCSSFLPADFPEDWSALRAKHDRHIGQQNINVVQVSQRMSMAVSLPPFGRHRRGRMRIRIAPGRPPAHLVADKCEAARLNLKKGLARARFGIEGDVPIHPVPRQANAWDLELNRGETYVLMLEMPRRQGDDDGTRVYELAAEDLTREAVVDGLTLFVANE